MSDQNAVERSRWGGPSPWAGKDSRTDVQKQDDQARIAAVRNAYNRLMKLGFEPGLHTWTIAVTQILDDLWQQARGEMMIDESPVKR